MNRRALLVIDVQNEYQDGRLPIVHPTFEESLVQIGRAMDAARAAGIPVVVVQQDAPADSPVFALGSHGWALHPAVAGRPADLRVHKMLPGAFTGTGLEEWLRARDVDTVTVVGYMTQHCVDTTARQAMHAGFTAEVLADATATLPYANTAGTVTAEEMHRSDLAALHARIAAVATTDAWLAAVRDGAALPAGAVLASAQAARAGQRSPA